MKKNILFVLMLLFCSLCAFAGTEVYLRSAYSFTYDTNVFSNPMVIYAPDTWLEWRVENPYEKRWNSGLHFESDLFFKDDAKIGMSMSLDTGWAHSLLNFVPEGDFRGEWGYQQYDATKDATTKFFLGIGPSFRLDLGIVDLGVNVKLSAGAFNFNSGDLIVGLMAEPHIDVFFSDDFFFTTGILYDAHLMAFRLGHPDEIFREDYVMVTIGAYLGVGMYLDGGK